MAAEHTQVSSYALTSAEMQSTQTLPVQTQPPTQLMSHEVPQFTQLIDQGSVEHVHCDTMLNSSDLEGSGNTLILHDDDASPLTSRGGSAPPDAHVINAQSAPPPQVGFLHKNDGTTAEDNGAVNSRDLDLSKKFVTPNILDSDATTEEGDINGIGYLDAEADAESRSPVDTEVDGAPDICSAQRTINAAVVANVTDMKSSQSRPVSSASVRTAPLCAPRLLVANLSASLDTAGKHDVKFDSNATREVFNSEPKEPFGALDAELDATLGKCANKAAVIDSMQSVPEAALPSDDTTHSPRMFTSTCVAPGDASLQPVLEQDPTDRTDTVELDRNAVEDLSHHGRVSGVPKTTIDHLESVSTPRELQTSCLKRRHSHQGSFESTKKGDQDGFANDANPGACMKRQPSSQNARELGFRNTETPMATERENGSGKFISVVHAPIREQKFSPPSGFRATPTNLSYLESQEPGEETQLNAFNMVDKLVWLDTTCMPDDIVTSPVPQDGSLKDHTGAKGLRSLAQAAQMKTVRDKLDVFDWEDSQADKGYNLPDSKQVPITRKRQSEAYKPLTARKRQATPGQKGMETTLQMETKSKDSTIAGREKATPDVTETQEQNMKLSGNLEMKSHTFLTTRLRNSTESGSRPSARGRKNSSSRRGPRKHAGEEKEIDESGKDFEAGRHKGSENLKVKVQKAGLGVKTEPRKRSGRKQAVDESGKDLKLEQLNGSNSKRIKFQQADSHSAKGNEDMIGNPMLGDRTSQDDAAADMWIEAFASTKNKIPTVGDVELIKFRKRSVLHEDTGQDSKKCRTMEPSTVEKEETPSKKNRVEIQKSERDLNRPENANVARRISRHKGRRVSTYLNQYENQDLAKKESNAVEGQQLITESKKPITADSQVKARRVSTRGSAGKDKDARDILIQEDKVEQGVQRRQDIKQSKAADADVVITRSVKTSSDNIPEKGPKTRSKAQDVKRIVAGSDVDEGNRGKNAVIESSTAQAPTNNKVDGQSLSRGAMQGDFKLVKPSRKTGRSKKKENLFSHQHLTTELNQAAQKIEGDPCQAGPPPVDFNKQVPAEGPKRTSRRREADTVVPESIKCGGNSVSQLKEETTDKSVPKMEELVGSKKGDVSKSTILRRTRSNAYDSGSQKHEFVDTRKDRHQSRGESATQEQTSQNHFGISDDNKGMKTQVGKADMKATKSVPRRNKKVSALETLEKLNSSDGGKRRKREPGCVRVLFSHSLTEDTVKHQTKILAKLGGQLATSASDCTHFVSNGFVRTQNMLISMAAGKIVATPLWLENCGQAHYFVDAKKYILQDKKKERELGFSMTESLASAERKPLFKGVQVLICPNTVPEPAVLQAIVESAGGQVMDTKSCSSLLDAKDSDTRFIIIGCEKDFDFCLQFLEKGLKVYSEELILHGIVKQTLDLSRNRLFEDFKQRQGRRRRAANISA